MRILVTGGAGFIGSAYVRSVLDQHPEDEIVVLDRLTYAGNPANLDDVCGHPRFRFVHGDIADAETVNEIASGCDAIVNFAAETHVDRSLLDAEAFARANVTGVMTLLDAARVQGCRVVQVSTDEVYGHIADGRVSTESDPLVPRSPYSAAKAGGELMCGAYHVSYGVDVRVTRGCNTIGPRQYPEKVVPLFITNALNDMPLPVYGDGMQVRDWMHVDDHVAAIDLVLRQGNAGETYNVGAGYDRSNMDVVNAILDRLKKPASLIRSVADRPGHDRRYALDATKLRQQLGWAPARSFEQTLNDTIDWYVQNPQWWQVIRASNGDFSTYYERQYGWRLAAATPV